MDVPRKNARRNKIIRRIVFAAIVLTVIPVVTVLLSRLKPAAPSVEMATLWPDTVKRGPMLRDVRGLGTLVPEDVLLIPAVTDGRVSKRLLLPGSMVRADTIIFELTNPQLETDAIDAEFNLKAAEAGLVDLRVQLQSKGLDQQAVAAQIRGEFHQARLKADRDAELAREGLIPDLDLKLSLVAADELSTRNDLEVKRLSIVSESVEAQLAAQRVKVEQLRALYQLKRSQVEQLKVRAGFEGQLQQLLVEVGQQVPAGTSLAKVAQPWKLKADLKIAETQAKDIMIGQKASIDTRNGIIPGRVMRIDPASVNGTVTVDVKLEGDLPPGARPDLSVDGNIELEKLDDVLYVGRPVFGQAHSTITLFKRVPGTDEAVRVQVKLGRTSVNTIEILEGLSVGDQVILSDMSAWDAYDRIRLN
ncbi:MAG: HlyD family efflux transporter periplasmic adaptor subunit [Bryobacteraceae bacterium]